MLTVAELIERLQEFPPDARVWLCNGWAWVDPHPQVEEQDDPDDPVTVRL